MAIIRADGSVNPVTPPPLVTTPAPQVVVQPVPVPGPQGPPGIQGPSGSTIIPEAQQQLVWHINESTGNNTNTGISSDLAVHDMDEIIRRVGLKWQLDTTVDIYLDSDITRNIHCSFVLGANGRVVFHGKRTVTRTGTISAYTTEDLASEACLIADGSQTWTAGIKIRTTTGSHPGAWCWVAKDKGSGVARVSHPGTNNYLVDALNTGLVSLSPGDTYNVETACVVAQATFDSSGGVNNTNNLSQIVFLDCDFVKLIVSFQPVSFVGCKFRFLQVGRISGTTNCCFTSFIIGTANAGSDAGLFLSTFFFIQYEGQWFFNNHPIFQAAKPVAKPSGLLFFEDYAGFFDVATPISVVYGAKVYMRHGLFGSGITGTAIEVQAGGQFRWSGTSFAITGQSFDVTLGGRSQLYRLDPDTGVSDATLLDLSFANLLASFVSGGFGGTAHDLYSNASFLQVPDSAF
jgi:hypothetical protein